MTSREEWRGFPIHPPKVPPTIPVAPGWTVLRADTDPTAGPVWLVEHCVLRRGLERRLAVVFAEQRPWGDTIEWLIECMTFVPSSEICRGASQETIARMRLHADQRFPGAGAIGRLAADSFHVVRSEIAEANLRETWACIDRRAEWQDADDPTCQVRNADLNRVREIHDGVLWARCGQISMTDCTPISER